MQQTGSGCAAVGHHSVDPNRSTDRIGAVLHTGTTHDDDESAHKKTMKNRKQKAETEANAAAKIEKELPVFVFEVTDIPVEPSFNATPGFDFLSDILAPFPKGKR